MKKLRKVLYVIVCVVAVILAVITILSVLRDTDSRFLKMLDYPRIQFFIASAVGLILFLLLAKGWQWFDYAFALALFGVMVVQGRYIVNYTPLVSESVPSVASGTVPSEQQISILLTNVMMTNRDAQPLVDLLQSEKPDIIIAMEVDDWWENQLEPLQEDYPYTQETSNSVAYGMALYSKYPLPDFSVNYLNNRKVPSYKSTLQLKNGKRLTLYSVHPVPPTRYEDLPDNENSEEVAMIKLGQKIKNRDYPVIVAGDINDVSWGATEELTNTRGLLRDVRVGRGFYNSYNANNVFMRWPLDHVFVTEEFQLMELERLSDIGSDHFPIYVKLSIGETR
ncbi:MAG TPA: endonuclease/exonuclease/phosphatase family protein [Cryomorphaceae bacterium]|nr:endonuclease/exonuclease/phosphatase family protein [Cryomorphaceae bacterium]